jgi:uncharacterized protein YbjT (DUF2867 family)
MSSPKSVLYPRVKSTGSAANGPRADARRRGLDRGREAIVVLGALDRSDAILTSDREDVERLVSASGGKLTILDV